MTMPRLSLYRPEKGNDYKFIDKTVWEMFQVGGTDVFVHKYLGPTPTPVWDAATAYKKDDYVSINNKVYKAVQASTTIQPPNTTYWKFIREGTPSQPIYTTENVGNIEDLLLLENRDRKYDDDIFVLRGVYNLQDTDFNLSQFGLFLQNDTLFITFHINDTVEKVGRKIIAGDVIELPHLKDEFALNNLKYALKRYYVIEEVTRAAEGYSVTWYPHLYRAKCKPMTASQEFQDILDNIANPEDDQGIWNPTHPYEAGDVVSYPGADDPQYEAIQPGTNQPPLNPDGTPNTDYWQPAGTIGEGNTTYEKDMSITQAILDQAELDAPKSGYDTSKYWTLQRSDDGTATLTTVDASTVTADTETQATDIDGNLLFDADNNPIYVGQTASSVLLPAEGDGYNGYLTKDGLPPNGTPFTAGIGFPTNPVEGQFCLRTDFLPNRLFRFTGSRWIKFEDNVRMTMNNLGASDVGAGDRFEGKDIRQTQKTSFINNNKTATIDGHDTKERQSLSKALRPKADE